MAARFFAAALAATALVGVAAPAASADWPVYGHDLSNTRSAGSDGPSATAVASMQRAWTFKSPNGDFTATPVVAGGTLVAGSNLGSIYALDAVTGKVRWSRDVGDQINGSAAIDLDAPGGPAVFVPVARIGSPHLVALSLATGQVRWDTTLTRQQGADVYGSPTFWHGAVYIGTSGPNNDEARARGTVTALNESNGAIRWQTYSVPPGDDGGGVWSTPAIDTATGRLYVGTGNAYHDPAADTTDSMMVLNSASGAILGHFQTTPGDVWELKAPAGPDYDFGASPNLMTGPGGRALVGEGSKSGTYWALDRATMKPVWNTMVGPGSGVGGILGSTAYDGTRIFGDDTIDSQVWSLGLDGSSQWNSADGGTIDFAPVEVSNGVVYTTGSSSFLTARDPATGSILTKIPLDGPTLGGASIVGKAVYVATGSGPPPNPEQDSLDTSKMDGSGSIIALGDTSQSGGGPAGSAPQRRPAIDLSVAPRSVQPGHRVVLRFRARSGSHPVTGALIRLGKRRARTRRDGRAQLAVRLPRAGRYTIRATRHGLDTGTATINAGSSASGSSAKRASTPAPKPLSFSGSCQISGTVYFQPALTNTPQDVKQHISAPGTCSGTLVDHAGKAHRLSNAPVTFSEDSLATSSTCLAGTATGTGELTFQFGDLHFGFQETRGVAFPLITLTGARSGSARALARPDPSEDPVATVQACNGSGLSQFTVDAQAQTTPEISG